MKNMKLFIAFLICIAVLFSATACGVTEKKPNATAQPTQNNESEKDSSSDASIDPTSGSENAIPNTPTSGESESTVNPNTAPENTTSTNEPTTPDNTTTPESEPAESNPDQESEPVQTSPENLTPNADADAYLAYYEMSAAEQQAFIDSFGSLDAFFAWHTAAKAAYEAERTPIDGSPIIP